MSKTKGLCRGVGRTRREEAAELALARVDIAMGRASAASVFGDVEGRKEALADAAGACLEAARHLAVESGGGVNEGLEVLVELARQRTRLLRQRRLRVRTAIQEVVEVGDE